MSQYKAHIKGSKLTNKSQGGSKVQVSTVEPIGLSSEQRRYLAIRTNVYELPIVSENNLRFSEGVPSGDLPVRGDTIGGAEPEMFSDQVEQILQDLEVTAGLVRPKEVKKVQSEKS